MAKFLMLVPVVVGQDPDIYAPASQATRLGCSCVSTCQTSHDINCHSDLWCEVANPECTDGAAHFAPQRHIYYDYCIYPAYWPYERKSAAEKETLLMQKIRANTTPQEWPVITDMYDTSMFISLNAVADVFPQPRKKYMHALGTVAPVRFVSSGNHPYTGLFKGAEHGLLRAGMTLPGKPQDGKWFDGVIPGVALKLFRDGFPSSNIVLIPDVKPQTCGSNFFDGNFSTHIALTDPSASPFLAFASLKLNQGTACSNQVGTSTIAAETDSVGMGDVFPFELEFVTSHHRQPIDCDDFAGSLANFSSIPSGARLYDVYARDTPGGKHQLVGYIELKGRFTTSDFGDRQLFFMHQPVEDDFRFRPDWLPHPDAGCLFAPWATQPPVEWGCSLCKADGCGTNDTMLATDVFFA